MTTHRLIAYVGGGLGSKPHTDLNDGVSHIEWNLHDKAVRMVPEPAATSLLQEMPADFFEAVPIKGSGITPAQVRKVGLDVMTFHPSNGEPFEVVPMTREMKAALVEAEPPKKTVKAPGKGEKE
jgi:hypothetical protein